MRNLILGFIFGILVVSVIEQEERITALEERLQQVDNVAMEAGQNTLHYHHADKEHTDTSGPMYYASTK